MGCGIYVGVYVGCGIYVGVYVGYGVCVGVYLAVAACPGCTKRSDVAKHKLFQWNNVTVISYDMPVNCGYFVGAVQCRWMQVQCRCGCRCSAVQVQCR